MTPVLTTNRIPPSYNLEDWQGGYESLYEEYAYEIEGENIEGEMPRELNGTLFRNGPGLFEINDDPIKHPFDADGMVWSVAFKEGRAYFRNCYVRTEGFNAEQEAGKILYRGVFGTKKSGGWWRNIFDFKLKNIANTNVIYWGEKLLALWEGDRPYRLNPYTLETIGLESLDGLLGEGDRFGAHPRIDPNCKMDRGKPCLVNFSIQPSLSSKITLYELSPRSGQLLRSAVHFVPDFAFIHDFVITPNYAIFFQNPVTFNPIPFSLGWRGAAQCIRFNPKQPTRIIVIPRNPEVQEEMQILETYTGFIFHHGNGFERDDKVIVVDSICYPFYPDLDPEEDFRCPDFENLPPQQLWRFTISLATGTVEPQLVDLRCCEFPGLNNQYVGRDYQYLYLAAAHHPAGNAPLQGILKLDFYKNERQFYSFAPKGFVGEPVFVPKPNSDGEDDGWLLVTVYDADRGRSYLAIFEARAIKQGPIAKLHFYHHIPYGLHGSWTPISFFPES